MPLDEEQIAFLKGLDRSHIHGKNMLVKKNKPNIEIFFDHYKRFQSALNGNLNMAVYALNQYKDFVARENPPNNPKFTSQSKFAPTILEEFICQVLRARFGNETLKYGSVSAYSSLYFSYSSKESFKEGVDLKINVKNQDVGVYKTEILTTDDGKRHKIHIPIVCIECKTYLDKTMYEGSVATAAKIKNGNPHCLFFIVTERYEVSSAVDISASEIDNIYILRKQRKQQPHNPIYADVIQHLLDWIDGRMTDERLPVDTMIHERGYLRN